MIMKYSEDRSIKNNNKGAALIVAVIVLLFVSILATVILYMSGINYRMKKSDLNTRISFYSAETPLETMQSDLVVPLSYALNKAYMSTNSRYVTFSSADDRRLDFYNEFYDALEDVMIKEYGGATVGNDGSSLTDGTLIKNMIHNLTYSSETDFNNGVDTSHIFVGEGDIDTITALGSIPDNFTDVPQIYIVIPDAAATGSASDIYESFVELSVYQSGALKGADECRLIFKNVGVVVCQNGYRSIITTDIAMQFPPLDWEGGMGTSTSAGDTSWEVYQLLYYVNWQKR